MIKGMEATFKRIYADDLAAMLDFEWDYENAPEDQLFDALEAMGYGWNEDRAMWLAPEQQEQISMDVSLLQESLKRGLSTVAPAVAGKSTLPVLANVLITAKDGGVTLSATNLEIGITTRIGAKVETDGAVTLPAKLLSSFVAGLPNDKVRLKLDEKTQTAAITCGRNSANVKGIESDEFPVIPTASGSPVATFSGKALREAIERTAFAAAREDTRPVLAGVLVRLKGTTATFAAADGFRLSVATVDMPDATTPLDVLIPARALSELARILDDDSPVEMRVTESGGQASFTCGDTTLVTRLIDGKFPDFERIIPTQHATRVVVGKAALENAVKLAKLFAAQSAGIVKLVAQTRSEQEMEPDDGVGLTISANASEVGDNKTELGAMVEGNDAVIAVNVAFLSEALQSIKTTDIAIELQTPQSPAVFKPIGVDGYTHVLMPMTVRD